MKPVPKTATLIFFKPFYLPESSNVCFNTFSLAPREPGAYLLSLSPGDELMGDIMSGWGRPSLDDR